MQGFLNELLIRNGNLEGQLEALRFENADQRREFRIAAGNIFTHPTQKREMTYAERVGVKSRTATLSNLKQDPPNVVTILPKDISRFDTSDKTKEAVI
ncbi:hypothetical protein WN55_08616 [Dufourea novaeangliae]|nr:hypothetical protein WN55_08616 [Dufourea novaeangliae]